MVSKMNIYNMLDYKSIVRSRIDSLKERDNRYVYKKVAAAISVQPPYLSKVMGGLADFNSDQMFLACRYLNFTEEDTQYLFLLLEYEKSVVKERRDILLVEIKNIQNKNLATDENIKVQKAKTDSDSLMEYYLDPLCSIVHMTFAIERYQSDIPLVAKDLGIAIDRINQIISKLERLGVISFEKGEVKIIKQLHLPSTSPLCIPHQNLLRQLTINHFSNLTHKNYYNLAISFTADENAFIQIREQFLDFLKKCDGIIDKAPSKTVYQLNFDLFPWSVC